jgi:hypothetical protein
VKCGLGTRSSASNNVGLITATISATLSIESATTIKGGGRIDLSDGGSLIGTPGAVLTNVSNSIVTSDGSANIGGSGWELVNQAGGEIAVISASAGLTIDLSGSGGFVSNAGQIVAGFGSMTIEGNIRNTSAGMVLAHAATVTLENSGNIVGGTLSGLGGVFDVPSGAAFTFDGGSAVVPANKMITIHAPVALEGTLNLQGAINNSGFIVLDSAARPVRDLWTVHRIDFPDAAWGCRDEPVDGCRPRREPAAATCSAAHVIAANGFWVKSTHPRLAGGRWGTGS